MHNSHRTVRLFRRSRAAEIFRCLRETIFSAEEEVPKRYRRKVIF
jgi:hypothetical protein